MRFPLLVFSLTLHDLGTRYHAGRAGDEGEALIGKVVGRTIAAIFDF